MLFEVNQPKHPHIDRPVKYCSAYIFYKIETGVDFAASIIIASGMILIYYKSITIMFSFFGAWSNDWYGNGSKPINSLLLYYSYHIWENQLL